ncbi:hypothetical protein N3K66_000296 [Trichothecium roseum]|uniref:Uncharacterized protein n=1 Tax=Trichothecium roseum TaxID=47278 RepID=A0ACC0VBK7_9HYPO|nr:hypothetical protein N3K66_000296 [Trichothecium roseum]
MPAINTTPKMTARPVGATRFLPAFIAVTSVAVVGTYVNSQLRREAREFDRSFSRYNTPASEAQRRKTYEGASDPRNSWFNILGW